MCDKITTLIESMFQELVDSKNELEETINANTLKINEIESYLFTLTQKEEEEFKIFSPRNIEVHYKEEILFERKEQENYKALNRGLKIELNRINSKLEKFLLLKRLMLENNDYSPNLIIEYLDNDRIRIAEELHDNTIQNLVHIIQKIEVSQKYLEKDTKKVHVELDNVISYAKETIQELREIIYNIKPMSLSDFNFTQTIQQLKEELEIVNKNKLNITYDIQYIENIEETYVLTIYRVIKECCVNAIKHSLGENIIVELKEIGDIIRISIMDDGLGINESKTKDAIEFSFGISMIKNRIDVLGGKLDISTSRESGTLICIDLPNSKKENINE